MTYRVKTRRRYYPNSFGTYGEDSLITQSMMYLKSNPDECSVPVKTKSKAVRKSRKNRT